MKKKYRARFIFQDLGIIALSILFAWYLAQTDILIQVLTKTKELEVLGSFMAGMFFTSVFTTAPAIATLGEIAQVHSLFWTALLGAAGAVLGDLIIFRFIKDRFSKHLIDMLSAPESRKVKAWFCLRYFRWFTFLLGGLVIASPLPDELGLSLLGFARMNVILFIPVSYAFNFVGILIIGLAAKALV